MIARCTSVVSEREGPHLHTKKRGFALIMTSVKAS